MKQIDLSGISVALLMPHRDEADIKVSTMLSLEGTTQALAEHGVDAQRFHHIGGVIENARSFSAKRFGQRRFNRAFWLDSDLVWKPHDFMKILAYSTRYPIIGAAYRKKVDKEVYLVGLTEEVELDDWGCMRVPGVGLGLTCMHREVLEKLSSQAPLIEFPNQEPIPDIFRFDRLPAEGCRKFRGEDMSFCADAYDIGYDTRVDPSIELGHIGWKTYTGRLLNVMQRVEGALPQKAEADILPAA